METDWSSTGNKDTLYHYTKLGKALEHILYHRRLRFSKGVSTNDPREYRSLDLSPHSDGTSTYEEYRQTWRKAEKSLAKCMSQYKYACFCLNDPRSQEELGVPGYSRLRMWAQYGQNFYGVCIAFSAQRLLKRISDRASVYSKPVRYVDLERTDAALSDIDAAELTSKNTDVWAESYMRDNLDQIFFSKHKDYRDEKEYRIVVHDPESSFEYIDITECIKAVLLGDRTEEVYHQVAKDLSRQMNVECKQVVWQSGKLHLIDV